MMDKSKIEKYGDELYDALINRKAVAPLTDREAEQKGVGGEVLAYVW